MLETQNFDMNISAVTQNIMVQFLMYFSCIFDILLLPQVQRNYSLQPERIYNSYYGNGVPAMFTS